MNAVRAEGVPTDSPLRTCIEADVTRDEVLIDVEAVAALHR